VGNPDRHPPQPGWKTEGEDAQTSPKRPKKIKLEKQGEDHKSERVVARATPREETNLRWHPLSPHMYFLKIAMLNINGIHTPNRIAMLHDFLRYHDIDVLFLQEVTHSDLGDFPGYVTHTNVGTTLRRTAFVTRLDPPVKNITKLTTGRGMAVGCMRMTFINIYAPSGTAKQAERESFFNNGLVYVLRNAPDSLLLGCDFNCGLESSYATGQCTHSRALATLVHGYVLRDEWTQPTAGRVYTHYSTTRATRIDRFYAIPNLYEKNVAAETVVTAFTDHHAVTLTLRADVNYSWREKGLWN
jgi:exonuclease III